MSEYNRIPHSSPWGRVQEGVVVIDGIINVGTAGHGGLRISPARLAQMPRALRLGRRRWFEEDAEAALVWLAFADELGLTDAQRAAADRIVADYFPDQWEQHHGRALAPGESMARDQATFTAEHQDRFVAVSASGEWHEDVPAGQVGVVAVRARDKSTRRFLVPADRYQQRSRFGYVVDEQADKPWPAGQQQVRAA